MNAKIMDGVSGVRAPTSSEIAAVSVRKRIDYAEYRRDTGVCMATLTTVIMLTLSGFFTDDGHALPAKIVAAILGVITLVFDLYGIYQILQLPKWLKVFEEGKFHVAVGQVSPVDGEKLEHTLCDVWFRPENSPAPIGPFKAKTAAVREHKDAFVFFVRRQDGLPLKDHIELFTPGMATAEEDEDV